MSGGGETISVLLDENVDKGVLGHLRREGYDGDHVVDAIDSGATDRGEILPFARERGSVVVTKDTDFLALDDDEHAGVVFVENHRRSAYEISTALVRIFDTVPEEELVAGVVYLENWV